MTASFTIDLIIFSKVSALMELHSKVLLSSTFLAAFMYKLQLAPECTH